MAQPRRPRIDKSPVAAACSSNRFFSSAASCSRLASASFFAWMRSLHAAEITERQGFQHHKTVCLHFAQSGTTVQPRHRFVLRRWTDLSFWISSASFIACCFFVCFSHFSISLAVLCTITSSNVRLRQPQTAPQQKQSGLAERRGLSHGVYAPIALGDFRCCLF